MNILTSRLVIFRLEVNDVMIYRENLALFLNLDQDPVYQEVDQVITQWMTTERF